MATIAVVKPLIKGAVLAATDFKAISSTPTTDTVTNPNGRAYLVLVGGGTDQTVTVSPKGTPDTLVFASFTISVPANAVVVAGPFDPTNFNSANNAFEISGPASATVKAFVLQPA